MVSVFHRYPQIERVQLFGSRAMGNYQPYSDIDWFYWVITMMSAA